VFAGPHLAAFAGVVAVKVVLGDSFLHHCLFFGASWANPALDSHHLDQVCNH
jgi:hypothetical protein